MTKEPVMRALICEIGASVAQRHAPHLKNAFLEGNFKLAAEGMAGLENNAREQFVNALLEEGGRRIKGKKQAPMCKDALEVVYSNRQKPDLLAKLFQTLLEIASQHGVGRLWSAVNAIHAYKMSTRLGHEIDNWFAFALTGKFWWPNQLVLETMITADYLNEFIGWRMFVFDKNWKQIRDKFKDEMGGVLVKTYREKYGDAYTELVTDANRKRIARLDGLAARMNEELAKDMPNSEETERIIEGVAAMVYGKLGSR